MNLVIDASVTIAWFFADEFSDTSKAILDRVAAEGAYVPSLWKLEVANVFQGAIRRKRCDRRYADQSLRRLERLQITVDQETDARAWSSTRKLAAEHALSMYDAAYLELALRRGVPLATSDMALAKAARRAGVELM